VRARDRKRPGRRQRLVERADDAVPEDHAASLLGPPRSPLGA
jgi:hypothetical protein